MARDGRLDLRQRRALAEQIRATQPCCHLCGGYIDLDRDRQRDPLGSCIDELIPRAEGGDPLDPANCAHAHRACNSLRGTRPVTPELRAECRQRLGITVGAPSRRW